MIISEWLEANSKNQVDLARAIGRNRVRAHRIVTLNKKPNDEEMVAIVSWTKGEVTANDFYPIHKTKRGRRNTHSAAEVNAG